MVLLSTIRLICGISWTIVETSLLFHFHDTTEAVLVFEFITEMQPVDALVIGLLWVLSVVVSTVLMWTLVIPKFLRKIILDMISTPSPDTKRAVSSLAAMIVSTPVDTGRKIKDDDGKEHPEIVPLLIYAGREIYATIQHKMSAGKGGANKKTQEK